VSEDWPEGFTEAFRGQKQYSPFWIVRKSAILMARAALANPLQQPAVIIIPEPTIWLLKSSVEERRPRRQKKWLFVMFDHFKGNVSTAADDVCIYTDAARSQLL